FGKIIEQKPYSYCMDSKAPVASAFTISDNILSFDVATYTETIVIDPIIEWATYFGGTEQELLDAIATDKNGNLYICGSTYSPASIATAGAFKDVLSGIPSIAFLAKFDDSGKRLWGTYYGNVYTNFSSVYCDKTGNVYVTGTTYSVM